MKLDSSAQRPELILLLECVMPVITALLHRQPQGPLMVSWAQFAQLVAIVRKAQLGPSTVRVDTTIPMKASRRSSIVLSVPLVNTVMAPLKRVASAQVATVKMAISVYLDLPSRTNTLRPQVQFLTQLLDGIKRQTVSRLNTTIFGIKRRASHAQKDSTVVLLVSLTISLTAQSVITALRDKRIQSFVNREHTTPHQMHGKPLSVSSALLENTAPPKDLRTLLATALQAISALVVSLIASQPSLRTTTHLPGGVPVLRVTIVRKQLDIHLNALLAPTMPDLTWTTQQIA